MAANREGNLSGANLSRASLSGANLSGANLSGATRGRSIAGTTYSTRDNGGICPRFLGGGF